MSSIAQLLRDVPRGLPIEFQIDLREVGFLVHPARRPTGTASRRIALPPSLVRASPQTTRVIVADVFYVLEGRFR